MNLLKSVIAWIVLFLALILAGVGFVLKRMSGGLIKLFNFWVQK